MKGKRISFLARRGEQPPKRVTFTIPKNRFTKYERELRNACKGTVNAIQSISEEWYADCDMRKVDKLMSRIMGWEFRIKRLLEKYQ